jgi:hypothetical protein
MAQVRSTEQRLSSYCYYGVRPCLCGTAAANGPFVHPPDDTWLNMEQRWNGTDRGNSKSGRKTCPSATLSTANPKWTYLGKNKDLHGEKPAASSLSCGKTSYLYLVQRIKMGESQPPLNHSRLHAVLEIESSLGFHLLEIRLHLIISLYLCLSGLLQVYEPSACSHCANLTP